MFGARAIAGGTFETTQSGDHEILRSVLLSLLTPREGLRREANVEAVDEGFNLQYISLGEGFSRMIDEEFPDFFGRPQEASGPGPFERSFIRKYS